MVNFTQVYDQVGISLLATLGCIKSVKIKLDTISCLQTCCKLLKQLASSLWIESLDNQLASSLFLSSSKSKRCHTDMGLMTARQEACSRLATTRSFLAVC